MPSVAVFQVNTTPDIGGIAMSRFHVMKAGGAQLGPSDANTAAAAIWALYQGAKQFYTTTLGFQFVVAYTEMDVASANIIGQGVVSTPPGALGGTGTGVCVAGTGIRLYWHTSTVKGRRLVRGATYLTPLVNAAYSSTNGINTTAISTVQAAGMSYVNACTTGGLVAVVYCRPAKGATTGGVAAPITAATVGATPGSLRSRRV